MSTKRIVSIDVLRGLTMVVAVVVNNPGSWQAVYAPLKHAEWHGVTPTDWVFPFFLFVGGMSIGIVRHKMVNMPAKDFWKKTLLRFCIIFLLGMILNYAPFFVFKDGTWTLQTLESLRIMGVLQRIAICYLVASIVIYFSTSIFDIINIAIGLLLVYWVMCLGLGEANDVYRLDTHFGTAWDIKIFGEHHLYQGEGVPFDPEGLASTIPACATTLLGYICFYYFNKYKTRKYFLVNAYSVMLGLLIIATVWAELIPMNKKLWTSSYALYTAALCGIVFLSCYLFFDKWDKFIGFKILAYSFIVVGSNAIFVYTLNGLLVRFLWLFRWEEGTGQKKIAFTPWSYLYQKIILPFCDTPEMASLLCALIMLMLMWAVAWLLYKRKVFIKV